MNYYPFHIGDYASATRHLSWDEDAAYRRLLDVYYTTEKPLPLDANKVHRLVSADTKARRDAVSAVLEEFFERTDAGWINTRADVEIEGMRKKMVAVDEKAAHEAERMSRYRARRATMFEALRDAGIIPSWDVPMKELQRLFDQHCNEPATQPETNLQREQVISGDAPATAIPTPTPTPTPNTSSIPNGIGESAAPAPARKRAVPPSKPDDVTDQTWADWLALRKAKKAPVTETVLREAVKEAEKAGLPLEQFLCVWCSRGSQGLQADWLKPHELQPHRPTHDAPAETYAQRAARQRMEEIAPMAARKVPGGGGSFEAAQRFVSGGSVIDVTARDVAPRIAGGTQ